MLKNFRWGLFSVVHLLFVLLVLGSGILLTLSAYVANVQNVIIHLLLQFPNFLLSIGIFLSSLGLLLFCGFMNMYKARYFKIKMGTSKVLVEEAIISDYIKGYWKQIFPNDPINLEVIIHPKQIIEIVTNLSAQHSPELFSKIETELGLLLARKLGYTKDFLLTITT